MKIVFNYDDLDFKSLELKLLSEKEKEEINEEDSVDLDFFKDVIVEPVMIAMRDNKPDNTYEVEYGDDSIKINCPNGDAEEILNSIYMSIYSVIKLCQKDLLDKIGDNDLEDDEIKRVLREVREMDIEEIKKELCLELNT